MDTKNVEEKKESVEEKKESVEEKFKNNIAIESIEDVLENKFNYPIDFSEEEKDVDYIIKNLVDFNNSVTVKQSHRYIPYTEFHTGYNNLHFDKDYNSGILPGKEQLEKNPFFKLLKDMPKGALHHTHLYTLIDYEKVIEYILKNQDKWEDNLYICSDPNSNFFLSPFMLPKDESIWRDGKQLDYESGLFKTPIPIIEELELTSQEKIQLKIDNQKNVPLVNGLNFDIEKSNEYNNFFIEYVISENKSKITKDLKLVYTKCFYINNVDNFITKCNNNNNNINHCYFFDNTNKFNPSNTNNNTTFFFSYPEESITMSDKGINNVKNLINEVYKQENYAKAFFIKLDTTEKFEQVTNDLCRAIKYTFTDCEAYPKNIYEMWGFSQPFYDLWINKFLRQNVFSSSFNCNNKENDCKEINKDFPTKWDLLERTTEIGGSLAKHHRIFPFFFGIVLLKAYFDKVNIIELRTPLGNLYRNSFDINNKLTRQKDLKIQNIDLDKNTQETNKVEKIYNDLFSTNDLKENDIFIYKNSNNKIFVDNEEYNVVNNYVNNIFNSNEKDKHFAIINYENIQNELKKNENENELKNFLESIQKKRKNSLLEKIKKSYYQLYFMERIKDIVNNIIYDKTTKPVPQSELSQKEVLSPPRPPPPPPPPPPQSQTSYFKYYPTLEKIINNKNTNNQEMNNNMITELTNLINEKFEYTINNNGITVKDIDVNNENINIDYTIIGASAKSKYINRVSCASIIEELSSMFILSSYIQNKPEISQIYPNRIVGTDLYGEEDLHHTDSPYEKILIYLREYAIANNVSWNYYFHAGENHNYIEKHSNLLLSILLDSKRIGHGLRIIGSPTIMELVKGKDICIECCPISNQVLDYTSNLSFHPSLYYLNSGINVSISTDDQNLYGYDSVIYDYTAIVNSWNLNLVQLKKLIENSLNYSSHKDKKKYYDKNYKEYWNRWVNNIYNYIDDEIIEKIIVSEYIKLKILFNKDKVYKEKKEELQSLIKNYFGNKCHNNDCTNNNCTECDTAIDNMFKKYLTNDFINNIELFFAKKVSIINYFSDYNWYKKCNINSNFYIDNTEKKITPNTEKKITLNTEKKPTLNYFDNFGIGYGGNNNPKNFTKHKYTKNNKLSNKKHLRTTKRKRYIL